MSANFLYSHVLTPGLVLLYFFVFAWLVKKASTPVFIGVALIPLMLAVRGFLSLFLLESGGFNPETGLHGFINGSTPLFFVFATGNIAILWWVTKALPPPKEQLQADIYDLLFLIVFMIEFFVAQTVRINFNLSDRFNFYGFSDANRLLLLLDVAFIGLFWAVLYRKTRLFWLWTSLFIIVGLSKNSGFSAIRSTLELVSVVLFAKGVLRPRHLVAVFAVGVLAVTVKLHAFDWNFPRLVSRFTMDNHVFWGALNLWREGKANTDFSTFISAFWDFSLNRTNPDFGFGQLMMALSPAFSKELMVHNVRFTCGFPAILIYKFGLYLALPAFALIAFLYWSFLRFVLLSMTALNPLIFLCLYKIFNLVDDFYIMGEYAYFRGKLVIFAVLLTGLIYAARKVSWLRRLVYLRSEPSGAISHNHQAGCNT